MKKALFICIIPLLISYGCNKSATKEVSQPKELRVMSFNIWVGGGKSAGATAKVMVESQADIIGVQESTRDDKNIAVHLADSLGWHSYTNKSSTSILSKYAIVDTTSSGYGVKIQLDEKQFVWMFNIHLMYCPYEPYQLNGIEYCGGPLLNTAEEAEASAWKTRGEEVLTVLNDIKEAQKDNFPVFLTGDFNEPSCLDWTSQAVEAGLCKTVVHWPATKAFIEQAQMRDSYRSLYPDEVKKPGHTWTSIPVTDGHKEVMDRIDFVLFWGKSAQPTKFSILGEQSEYSDVGFSDYPSDHRAIVGTFTISQ